jgi:hypothetical protein
VLILLPLAACAEPQPNVDIHAGPSGVAVTPSVSTNVGAARIGLTPHGARLGTKIAGVGIGIGL